MSVRNLLGLALVFLCLAGCEKVEKRKKDDFIIKRRDRVVVRYEEVGDDGINAMPPAPESDITVGADTETFSASVSDNILSVSFLDLGTYDLYIVNASEEVVYSSELPADGQVYEFDISAVAEEDRHVLVLTGSNGVIKWYF